MTLSSRTAAASARTAPITLDTTQADQLEALAAGASRGTPDLADRLLTEIARARIVEPGRLPRDVIALGREVTYRDETTGREQTVVLVLPQQADIAKGRASVMTPIGVALIGLREGSSFSWETRDGELRRLTVVRVSPDPA
jgi:regulator of nucleoside diphosphate kinase